MRGKIEIARDVRGVAHIHAEHEADAYAALGYLQGADRFVLMDLIRHVGAGRLCALLGNVPVPVPAELLGGGGLAAVDRFVRPLGFEADAERDHPRLPPRARACIDAFSEGVNAALRAMDGAYPDEYLLLAAPKPWRPEDTLLCQRTSGFIVTLINLDNELIFDAVRAAGGDDLARLLHPEAPWENCPTSYAARGAEPPEPPLHLPAGGSNNWAVGGALAAGGAPILANDPHVPAIPLPTYWMHAHLECPEYRVQGGVFPGAPLFGWGHNGHLAWGCTTAFRDAWDLVRIHRSPGDPTQYRTPRGYGRLEARRESLPSRFGGTIDVTWEQCEHGIVYPGWKHHDGVDLALRFVSADIATYVDGYLDLAASRSVDEHRAALAKMNEGPFDFNHVYAHRDGHIGWEMFGRLPRREKDGLFVRDAHDPDAQWNGYRDFAENPKILAPAGGAVASANSVTDRSNFEAIATLAHFEPRYRQDRIESVLGARRDHTTETMSALHADVVADYAPAVRDALVALTAGVAAGSVASRAREALAAWDGRFDVDSDGAPVFFFVQQRLLPLVFVPLLGTHVGRRFATGRRGLPRLQKLLVDAADPLRAAIESAAGRTLDAMALESLDAACTRIAHGCDTQDVSRWRWGSLQRARLGGLLAHLPGIGNRLVAHDGPYPGDDYTVNPNRALDDGKHLRVLVTGTSRFVCDLSKPDEATFMHSSGPCSDFGSLWHANLCGPWARFETFRSALWKPDDIPDVVERLVIGSR